MQKSTSLGQPFKNWTHGYLDLKQGYGYFLKNHWKSRVLKKFAYIVGEFFKKAILRRSKIKINPAWN